MSISLHLRLLRWLAAMGIVFGVAIVYGALRTLFSPRRGTQLGLLATATAFAWLTA